MIVTPPTSTDNTPLIAGVVVGSLLFLAVIALVVFFVRRRNSKAATMPARSGENGMASARNEYGQLPGAKTYDDAADVRAIAANSYGNVNVSPKGEYDAPDSPFTL
jgi:hypothetical protein